MVWKVWIVVSFGEALVTGISRGPCRVLVGFWFLTQWFHGYLLCKNSPSCKLIHCAHLYTGYTSINSLLSDIMSPIIRILPGALLKHKIQPAVPLGCGVQSEIPHNKAWLLNQPIVLLNHGIELVAPPYQQTQSGTLPNWRWYQNSDSGPISLLSKTGSSTQTGRWSPSSSAWTWSPANRPTQQWSPVSGISPNLRA